MSEPSARSPSRDTDLSDALAHPHGVRPVGARLAAGAPDTRGRSLGQLAKLDDALLLQLLGHCGGGQLGALACASRWCYCFATHEELWRALALQVRGAPLAC